MQATDWIRKKAKSFTTIQTTANIPLRAVTGSSRAPVSHNNTFFSRLSNSLRGTITATPCNSDAERLWLMNKGKCFNCKERGHTMLNCLEKAKVSAITNALDIDDIENVN